MPIRVCQLITELELSGAERVVYELSRRLDRSRFEVRVAALLGGEVEDMLLAAGVPVDVLNVRGKWDAGKLLPLWRMLRRERIDILHTHLFHADLAGRAAAVLASVPHVVHTIHVAEQRFRPWQFAFARLAGFACDRLVCVSRSVLDHHSARSGLPKSRYAVIPNGVDVPQFARDEQARARTRQQWGLSDRQQAVLFVGRLDRQKGLDVLLDTMPRLAGRDLRFILAGNGPMRGDVERFMANGSTGLHCRHIGFVADIRAVLSAADIFVLPSRWEGWPLALAEAMVAGLPCVGTDVPGIHDIIESGRTGLLVPPENPAALAGAISRIAGDAALRQTLAQAGQREIVENYSIERNVAAHERLYEEITK